MCGDCLADLFAKKVFNCTLVNLTLKKPLNQIKKGKAKGLATNFTQRNINKRLTSLKITNPISTYRKICL